MLTFATVRNRSTLWTDHAWPRRIHPPAGPLYHGADRGGLAMNPTFKEAFLLIERMRALGFLIETDGADGSEGAVTATIHPDYVLVLVDEFERTFLCFDALQDFVEFAECGVNIGSMAHNRAAVSVNDGSALSPEELGRGGQS